MGQNRYVKTAAELEQAEKFNAEFLPATMFAVKAFYETDAELVAAVLPRPLKPAADPLVRVVICKVTMDTIPGMEFGAATFGVLCNHEGVDGIYEITMPMSTEGVVVGGRETYGEPKKIADINVEREGDKVLATVERWGITYLELSGTVTESLDTEEFTDHVFCFKGFPAVSGKGLEADPWLIQIDMHRTQQAQDRVEGEIILRESSFDPVADLPVRKIRSMAWEVGGSSSKGQVLRTVPADWLRPFFHQRYDDTAGMLADMMAGDAGAKG